MPTVPIRTIAVVLLGGDGHQPSRESFTIAKPGLSRDTSYRVYEPRATFSPFRPMSHPSDSCPVVAEASFIGFPSIR